MQRSHDALLGELLSDHSAHQMRFECHQCKKTYKYRYDLSRHMRDECGIEPQFQCPICDFRTKRKSTLKSHLYLKHYNEMIKLYG